VSLPYVLVADADGRRTTVCIQAIAPHGTGVLVARTGDEAIGVLRDFGTPLLLIVDLQLPGRDGFSVIEAVRQTEHERTAILAWSSARELREFAVSRLAGMDVRVMRGSVAPTVIQSTIDHLLARRKTVDTDEQSQATAAETVYATMSELSEKARQLSHAAGVAVYFRDAPDQRFRSTATWLPDEPTPRSLDPLPIALNRILETREAMVVMDLSANRAPGAPKLAPDELHSLIAVPIAGASHGEIAGMLCVFDIKPLALGNSEIAALKALGERSDTRRTAAAPLRVAPPSLDRQSEPQPALGSSSPAMPNRGTLLDRKVGSLAVSREMERARREQRRLSVVVLDVAPASSGARIERIEGRDLVDSAGQTVARMIRGYDLAIRWSHDELIVVLPGVAQHEAGRVADRVRAAIRAGAGSHFAVNGSVAELNDESTLESVLMKVSANRAAR
jgi:DNA-binding response OmpR family regulator/GGDEF domain-containing protein